MSTCTRRSTCRQFSLLLAALLGMFWAAGLARAQQPSEAAEPSKATETVKRETVKDQPVKSAERGTANKSKKKKTQKSADEAKPEPAPADPHEDPDFAFLGEFAGPVSTGTSKYQRLALQVKPVGHDRFEALQYSGGLPGEKSHHPAPVALIGKRAEGFLVLSGGPWAVFVEPDRCLVVDRRGERVGRLERLVRQSPTMGAQPPKDAIVLFDGKDTSQFVKARMTDDGLLMEGANIKPMLQDFNLHLEFMLPYLPAARDQGRGNSGIYLQSRYELQILDSFAEEPRVNGCGSLYRFREPDVNMCLPPLAWQTYDIAFTAPRWSADRTKLKNARVTIWHNGVKVHNNRELANKTGAGKPEEPTLLPTFLQDHKNPVRFRNVWIVDRGDVPAKDFPVFTKAAEKKAADKKPADKKGKPAAPRPKRTNGKKPSAGADTPGDAQHKPADPAPQQSPQSDKQ